MKIPENIEKEPDEPEAADADIQMEYSNQLYSPRIAAVTKKFPVRTWDSIGFIQVFGILNNSELVWPYAIRYNTL